MPNSDEDRSLTDMTQALGVASVRKVERVESTLVSVDKAVDIISNLEDPPRSSDAFLLGLVIARDLVRGALDDRVEEVVQRHHAELAQRMQGWA